MGDNATGIEKGHLGPKELISFGTLRGVEIFRYQYPDRSYSGILFPFAGGVMTARHVAKLHNLSEFKLYSAQDVDIAYKRDAKVNGLPLGYVDRISIDGVEMITSSIKQPEILKIVPGRVGVYFLPTYLHPFSPKNAEDGVTFFKPGASGSPLLYKEHIIGLVPFQNLKDPYEVAAVVFSGEVMRQSMADFGLTLEEVI